MDVVGGDVNSKVYYLRKYGDVRMYAQNYSHSWKEKVFKNQQSYEFDEKDFDLKEHFPNVLEIPAK